MSCNRCACVFRHTIKQSRSMCSQPPSAFESSPLLMSMMIQIVWYAWMMSGVPYLCRVVTVCVAKAVQKQWCRNTNTALSVARLWMAIVPPYNRHTQSRRFWFFVTMVTYYMYWQLVIVQLSLGPDVLGWSTWMCSSMPHCKPSQLAKQCIVNPRSWQSNALCPSLSCVMMVMISTSRSGYYWDEAM